MPRKYLIFLDILGFGALAEKIGIEKKLKPKAVRAHFIRVIKDRITQLTNEGLIESQKYGETDDWLLVAKDLPTVFKILSSIFHHVTDYLDYKEIPLEIAVGAEEFDEVERLTGSDLVIEDSTIRFLQSEVLKRYHGWYKEQKGDAVTFTFVVFTESAYRELEESDQKDSRKIQYKISYTDTKNSEHNFYSANLTWIKQRGKLYEFLDKIRIDDKDPPNLQYDRIDELYVSPVNYGEIQKALIDDHSVFITGPPEFGKTYTAVRLLWDYYNKGYEPSWKDVKALIALPQSGLMPRHITYFEDPFGKKQYVDIDELKRTLGVSIAAIRQTKDVYAIITSKEELFKEFDRLTPEDHTSLVKKLKLQSPSYDDEQRQELVLKWASGYACEWLKNTHLTEFVLKCIKDKTKLPTPLSIKNFAQVTSKTNTLDGLKLKIKEQSAGAEEAFATDIRKMTGDKVLFLSFPFLGEFPVNFVESHYRVLVQDENFIKTLKLDSLDISTFDELVAWFKDDKIEISRGRLAFSHRSYHNSLARLRNEPRLATIFKKLFPKLITALDHEDYIVRMSAADGLGEMRDPRALQSLIKKLMDKEEDKHVRFSAELALGRISDSRAISPLIRVLNDEDDMLLTFGAVMGLGWIGEPAVNSLIDQLRDEETDKLRVPAVMYGLRLAGEPAIDPLILILNDKSNSFYVRLMAAAMLGQMAHPKGVTALTEIIKDKEQDLNVRVIAGNGLKEVIGEQATLAMIDDEDPIKPRLKDLFK
jgi:HEAT repeats